MIGSLYNVAGKATKMFLLTDTVYPYLHFYIYRICPYDEATIPNTYLSFYETNEFNIFYRNSQEVIFFRKHWLAYLPILTLFSDGNQININRCNPSAKRLPTYKFKRLLLMYSLATEVVLLGKIR
jgi:hypothetical protein